jgi:hypothetical protein
MILQSIKKNTFGTGQKLSADKLKFLAFIEAQNKNQTKTEVVKRFKNGSYIEEETAEIVITVDKNKNRKTAIIKLIYKCYKVVKRAKFIEDKNIQFKNGNYFIKCLGVEKLKYQLLESQAV